VVAALALLPAVACEREPVLAGARPVERWAVANGGGHAYAVGDVAGDAPAGTSKDAEKSTLGFAIATERDGTTRIARLLPNAPGAPGYAFSEPGPGHIALHALARATPADLLLTTGDDEAAKATDPTKPAPYEDRGIVGYLVPYFEVGEPTGSLAPDGGPRGIMMVIHGGGWQSRGRDSVASERNAAEVERWRARGWRTIAISYRSSREGPAEEWPLFPLGQKLAPVPGSARRSIEDVLWFHDRIRDWQGWGLPMCATGWSAGGHLALLLVAERRDVACVIALAAPTDLPALVAASTDGGRAAVFAFGRDAATSAGNGLSPVDVAGSLRARLLLASASNDAWVPPSQMGALRDALARSGSFASVATMELEPGRRPFWHGNVSQRALDEFHAAEAAFAEQVAR